VDVSALTSMKSAAKCDSVMRIAVFSESSTSRTHMAPVSTLCRACLFEYPKSTNNNWSATASASNQIKSIDHSSEWWWWWWWYSLWNWTSHQGKCNNEYLEKWVIKSTPLLWLEEWADTNEETGVVELCGNRWYATTTTTTVILYYYIIAVCVWLLHRENKNNMEAISHLAFLSFSLTIFWFSLSSPVIGSCCVFGSGHIVAYTLQ